MTPLTLWFANRERVIQGHASYQSLSGDVRRYVTWQGGQYMLDAEQQGGPFSPGYREMEPGHDIPDECFHPVESA